MWVLELFGAFSTGMMTCLYRKWPQIDSYICLYKFTTEAAFTNMD